MKTELFSAERFVVYWSNISLSVPIISYLMLSNFRLSPSSHIHEHKTRSYQYRGERVATWPEPASGGAPQCLQHDHQQETARRQHKEKRATRDDGGSRTGRDIHHSVSSRSNVASLVCEGLYLLLNLIILFKRKMYRKAFQRKGKGLTK